MPFPDAKYPSLIPGLDRSQAERILAVIPDLLAACRLMVAGWGDAPCENASLLLMREALAKADGQ